MPSTSVDNVTYFVIQRYEYYNKKGEKTCHCRRAYGDCSCSGGADLSQQNRQLNVMCKEEWRIELTDPTWKRNAGVQDL